MFKKDGDIWRNTTPPIIEIKEPTAKGHTLMYIGAMAKYSEIIDFRIDGNTIQITIELQEN